jgi:hypothetical protein
MSDYNAATENILACVVDVVTKSPSAPVDKESVGRVMSRYGPMYALNSWNIPDYLVYPLIELVHFPGPVYHRIGNTSTSSTKRQAIASAPEQRRFRVSSLQESLETLLTVAAFLALFSLAPDRNPCRHLVKPSDTFLTTLPARHMPCGCAMIPPLLIILALQRPALVLASLHVLHLTILEPQLGALPESPRLVL